LATREYTQGKNPMGVMIVVKFLGKGKTLLYIRKFIQKKNPVNVLSLNNSFLRLQTFIFNKKSILWKNSPGYKIPVSPR
jgi:hypothetical protein